GWRNCGNFSSVTTGAGMTFGAHALAHTSAARRSLRIKRILIRVEAAEKASRNVRDDRGPAVARLVRDDPAVAVDAGNPLAVGRIVGIERERDAPDVEGEPRSDGFDQLVNPLAVERRDAERRRVELLEPPPLVGR